MLLSRDSRLRFPLQRNENIEQLFVARDKDDHRKVLELAYTTPNVKQWGKHGALAGRRLSRISVYHSKVSAGRPRLRNVYTYSVQSYACS